MPRIIVLFTLLTLLFVFCGAQNNYPQVVKPNVSPSLKFTQNNGQWLDQILYKATLDGGALYVERDGLTFDFYDKKKYRDLHHGGILKSAYKDFNIQCHAYKMEFLGCNEAARVDKYQQGTDYENFYLGNDKSKWKSQVNNFHELWFRSLYPNIDYEVITAVNGIKYNFHVYPGGDSKSIQINYKGIKSIKLKEGSLLIDLEVNGVREQKPYAYQIINGKVIPVICEYQFKNKILGFNFPNGYDKNFELVIDPLLVFAAQSGSSADNFGATATFDAAGNLYAGGTVYGQGYPTTLGAYNVNFSGPTANSSSNTDVSITKYNPTGNALIYSTYIGGSQTEVISSMIVDGSDNLCIYGATGSSNFPTLSGAYDNTFNGGVFLSFIYNGTSYNNGTDIYVTKFNSSGSALLASTYIGGSGNDGVNHVNHTSLIGNFGGGPVYEYVMDSLQYNYGDQYRGEIQVDVTNNIYIVSSSRSSNFPIVNGYDNTLGGKQDAVVIKFNPGLTQVIYSTYLGGNKNESGNSLIVNNNFEVYVTGGTCSNDFPTTTGANSTVYNGGKADGYVTHLNASGNALLHSTYIGTNDYDQSYFVQFDKYNNIFVYGQSLGNMPIVNSGTLVPFSVLGTHQFVTRFNASLSNKTLSMVFGHFLNAIDISPCAFAVDKCNNLYLSGWGGNIISGPAMSNMPMFLPTQSTTDGYDFYFMGLDSNFVLKYGSYFGGVQSQEHVDGGTSRFDARGKIYQSACAGCGGHDDWPVTNGAWPNTPGNQNHSSNCNNGVVKLDFQLQISLSTIHTGTLSGCAPLAVTFTNASPPTNSGASYVWHMGNGISFTNVPNPSSTYTAPGVYTVALVTNDNLTCNKKDSTITYVTVFPGPSISINTQYNPCSNTVALSGNAIGNLSSNPYSWNFGDGSPTTTLAIVSHTYTSNGTFTLTFSATYASGCTGNKTATISLLNFTSSATGAASVCVGNSITLNAQGGTNYIWTPSVSLNSGSVASPISTPASTTIYTVSIINNSTGSNCSRTHTLQLDVRPTPTANFSYSLNPCGGGAYFTDQSKDNVTNWFWIFASGKTSTVQNPYYFYTTGGTYTISLTSSNAYGCKDRKEIQLQIDEPPTVSAHNDVQICRGDKVQLSASGGVSYDWSPKTGLTAYDIANPIATPLSTTAYSVIITTTGSVNGKTCSFLLSTDITVDVLSSTPISAYANPVTVVMGNSTNLYYVGEPGASISWLPPNLVTPTNAYTVTSKPIKSTTYTVIARRGACVENLQVVVDAYTDGCIDKDTFIPNTFTPNGDGENDVLFVRGLKVTELYFAVYNRWGEMVFETNDIHKGWDGRYKGKSAESGVFGWYLKAKCFNGQESFRKGNVTLVR